MSSETLAFLRHVLPSKGIKVACVKFPNGMRQFFADTCEEQAAILLKWSAKGYDTYHACATFKDRSSRKASNALAARSLWADIDTCEGKPGAPYKDRVEAGEAVMAFTETLALPLPTIVSSGYGLHVYWPFNEDLEPQQWLRYAKALKHACSHGGLHIDPARTADIASILRTPGTANYKVAA